MDAREAAQRARDYLISLLGEVPGIRLEEVEQTEDNYWLITLSFVQQESPLAMFGPRTYKVFKVTQDGEVVGMKIGQLK